MAETSLNLEQLLRKLMGDEHADVLRESLDFFVHELMEAEVTEQIGAGLHERCPDARRTATATAALLATRAGEVELAVPRLRSGSYFPSFLEPRSRSEQVLVAVVQEAYVNGVSTRKGDRHRSARPSGWW